MRKALAFGRYSHPRALDMAIQESFELRDGKITGITPFYFDTKTFAEFLNEETKPE